MNHSVIRQFIAIAILFCSISGFAQNDNSKPENAYPFCDTSGVSFPGGVNVPDAFPTPKGCLETSPNPAWFYFRVDVAGSLIFTINSTPATDIDFIAWGPFTHLNLGDVTQYIEQNQIDCSYSGATSEQIDVSNAQVGDYFVVLVTNYSNTPNSINFDQTGGTGSTDCNLLIGSSNSPICEGQKLKLLSSLNPSLYTFEWSGPNGFSSTAFSPEIPDAGMERAGTYRLIVTDFANKKDTVDVEVEITPIPRPVITGDTTICNGLNPLLGVSGGPFASYTWMSGANTIGGNQDTITVGPGTYTVRVTSANGCFRVSAPVTVKQSNPKVEIIGMSIFCEGDTLLLTATEGFANYSWSVNGQIKSTSNSLNYYGGNLVLIARDAIGCADTVKADVTPAPQPKAAFTFNPPSPVKPKVPIQFTDQSTITGGDITKWYWLFTPPGDSSLEQNPTYAFEKTGQKQVMLVVRTLFGCVDTAIVNLAIVDELVVYNAFSPNGDKDNETFTVTGLPDYPNNKLIVYNRWGKKVFEADNYQNDWNGDNLPTGTYFYVITAPAIPEPLKGSFNLFRD